MCCTRTFNLKRCWRKRENFKILQQHRISLRTTCDLLKQMEEQEKKRYLLKKSKVAFEKIQIFCKIKKLFSKLVLVLLSKHFCLKWKLVDFKIRVSLIKCRYFFQDWFLCQFIVCIYFFSPLECIHQFLCLKYAVINITA